MQYYEVLPADSHYKVESPLTYSYDGDLPLLSIVTIPLKNRFVSGFVLAKTKKPKFATKQIKALIAHQPLPAYCLDLARWLQAYYCVSLAEALRQYSPSKVVIKRKDYDLANEIIQKASPTLDAILTTDQAKALRSINASKSSTVLLHGETGSGKTRVYLELARETLKVGQSVLLLTPEISLTAQLAKNAQDFLKQEVFVIHSQLSDAARKKLWFKILESDRPVVIVGPRSAVFSPVANLGLIIVDEAHEPAYKQEQSPRYLTTRVASRLGLITGARVIFGSATPSLTDYYLASEKGEVVRMSQRAVKLKSKIKTEIVDIKDRANFNYSPYLSNQMLVAIKSTLSAHKQVMIYLNRRGSARLIMCSQCGWQLTCPNCDIPLVYHADQHLARCHICNYRLPPPANCPLCQNPEIIFKTIGTKALYDELLRHFGSYSIQRFDGDNKSGERLNDIYPKLLSGEVNILVGTQVVAKGLDLPRLGMVGIVAAESSLGLPDYSSEERSFQLLYQVIGRVGRGHGDAHIVIQSYDAQNILIKSAASRNYESFYNYALAERRKYKFPPYSYLLQLVCKRSTDQGGAMAANRLKAKLASLGFLVEFMGPSPCFYARRGDNFYYQLVVKSKQRSYLLELAKHVPADWQVDLDPVNLL